MQKILYTTAITLTTVFVAASCKDNGQIAAGSVQTVPVSTTEFQEFQTWKQQQLNNTNTNTASYASGNTPVQKPATKVVYRDRLIEKPAPAPAPVEPIPPIPPQKKGWSKAAKGTAIGAAAGAGAGALILKKNRALGAVIGGVVGGGVGYGIGRSQDKKDGRY